MSRYGTSTKPYQKTKRNMRDLGRDNKPKVKHSGCKARKDFTSKSGKKFDLIVTGWKFTKQFGMTSFVAVPSKNAHGKDPNYRTMVVKFTSAISQSTVWGQWNIKKQLLWIPDFNFNADCDENYCAYVMPKSFK